MRTIIATDVHGITDELRSMLAPLGSDAVFLSPWPTDACPFSDEHEAVSAFVADNGIARYAQKIRVAANSEPAFIVAFSLGASASWLYAASQESHPASVATLFYGSRIRDYASLFPRFGITAIFAEYESGFSPVELAEEIAAKTVRTTVEPRSAHGFMNPRSTNFAPSLCSAHLMTLVHEQELHRRRLCAVPVQRSTKLLSDTALTFEEPDYAAGRKR